MDVLPPDDGQVVFPVPLGDGTVARLLLPLNLQPADADKLCAVIKALADK